MTKEDLHKKDVIYYAHIIPKLGVFDLCEIIVRTIEDNYFVGIDKRDKRAYPFSYKDFDNIVFLKRGDALNKIKEAEKNKPQLISTERYYEEY